MWDVWLPCYTAASNPSKGMFTLKAVCERRENLITIKDTSSQTEVKEKKGYVADN